MRIRIILFTTLLFFTSSSAIAADITQLIKDHSDFDDKIRDTCRRSCQGNRRHGDLERMTISHHNGNDYDVYMRAFLKSHQHQDTLIGGGFAIYSYTVHVDAWGTLNSRTCDIQITRVKVLDDDLGIARGAYDEVGKVHHVNNCQQYTNAAD